jgi:ADP-ribose pyrophosphatase
MDFTILDRETTYQTRAFSVQKVNIQLPNDHKRIYDLVVHNDSVTIVPVDQDGNIWFVTQYRLGSESQLLELPAGVMEADEDPSVCAAREIREETGMAAGNLQYLGGFYLAPGYSNEHMEVFLATKLYPAALEPDADEFLKCSKVHFSEAVRMSQTGQIHDAKTIAALMMASPFFK